MNAKELAESYREDAKQCREDGRTFWADTFDTVAGEFDQLVPRYRPPQPSDDGRWCFLEHISNVNPRPFQVRRGVSGEWLYRSSSSQNWYPLTGGVWPCERPEVGGAS